MKKKIIVYVTLVLCVIALIIGTIFLIKKVGAKSNLQEATLIQLATTNDDRMMGYIMITKNGKVIVVDGGNYEDGPKLESYLARYGAKVDLWLITHYHRDHAGAFRYVVENGKIEIASIYNSLNSRELVQQNEPIRLEDYDKFYLAITDKSIKDVVHEASLGQTLYVDDIKIKVLGIKNEEITNNFGNNQSMVTKFILKSGTSLIFLGDTGIESEEKLKENFLADLKADYVQMAHHGQAGVSEEMYKIINPKYCLWPTTYWIWNNDIGNGYNTHTLKTIETREWISKIGAKNYVAYDEDKMIKIY